MLCTRHTQGYDEYVVDALVDYGVPFECVYKVSGGRGVPFECVYKASERRGVWASAADSTLGGQYGPLR